MMKEDPHITVKQLAENWAQHIRRGLQNPEVKGGGQGEIQENRRTGNVGDGLRKNLRLGI